MGLAVLANGNGSAYVADLVLVAILRLPGKCSVCSLFNSCPATMTSLILL